MFLSDREIRSLSEGTYNPLLYPFEEGVNAKGVSHGLSSAGYDVRIGTKFLVTPNMGVTEVVSNYSGKASLFVYPEIDLSITQPKYFDPRMPENIEYRKYEADFNGEILLAPGAFVLAETIEHFIIPSHIVGLAKDKSSWARRGIAVQNTVLEPGWSGILTLEISNHGAEGVCIPIGCGISQILFGILSSNPEISYADRRGKYQNQSGVTAAL